MEVDLWPIVVEGEDMAALAEGMRRPITDKVGLISGSLLWRAPLFWSIVEYLYGYVGQKHNCI